MIRIQQYYNIRGFSVLRIPKEDRTATYYKGINRLLCSTHWVNELGEESKIPQGLKVYYQYRKNRFDTFQYLESTYYEKHTTVGKVLGISVDTIKKVYNPMLKEMGLIETAGNFKDNNVNYVVYDLDNLQGELINRELKKCKVNTLESNYTNENDFTFNNMQNLDHNKKVARRVRSNSDELMTAISIDRFRELIAYERQLKDKKEEE